MKINKSYCYFRFITKKLDDEKINKLTKKIKDAAKEKQEKRMR